MKHGAKALPAEHQGTARGVLEAGKLAKGGIPDANQVITGVVLDEDKRGKVMDAASGAGKKVWGWIKGSDGDGEAKAKPSAKADRSGYPDDERQQVFPKRPATKK
jgi:hypothetical protein